MTNDAAVAWVVVDQTLRKDSPDPNFMDGAYWMSFETVSADRALSVVKERQSIRPTGKYEVVALVPATTVAELRARVAELEGLLSDTVGNLRRMANDEFADCEQVRLEHVVNRIEHKLARTSP